jgi:hypothetical protein
MGEWLAELLQSYLAAHPFVCATIVPLVLVATIHQYFQIRRMQWGIVTEMRGERPDKLRSWDWLWFGFARQQRPNKAISTDAPTKEQPK